MSEHIPGPWKVGKTYEDEWWCVATEIGTGRGEWESSHDIAIVFAEPDDETSVNASLIAAAPDMLEALEGVIRFHAHSQTNDPSFLAAKAAILKAKGDHGS